MVLGVMCGAFWFWLCCCVASGDASARAFGVVVVRGAPHCARSPLPAFFACPTCRRSLTEKVDWAIHRAAAEELNGPMDHELK